LTSPEFQCCCSSANLFPARPAKPKLRHRHEVTFLAKPRQSE
jgi:hypothetical protein